VAVSVGDFRSFIQLVHNQLLQANIDAVKRGYIMDHICFRTKTAKEYQQVVAALVPAFGESLVEGVPRATCLAVQLNNSVAI
jgi:hypothetical protein